jgi:hypothetical protein
MGTTRVTRKSLCVPCAVDPTNQEKNSPCYQLKSIFQLADLLLAAQQEALRNFSPIDAVQISIRNGRLRELENPDR